MLKDASQKIIAQKFKPLIHIKVKLYLRDESDGCHPHFPKFGGKYIGSKFGVLGRCGDNVLGLPLELKHGILLEEEGDHRDILFICIIGVVQSRCEDS